MSVNADAAVPAAPDAPVAPAAAANPDVPVAAAAPDAPAAPVVLAAPSKPTQSVRNPSKKRSYSQLAAYVYSHPPGAPRAFMTWVLYLAGGIVVITNAFTIFFSMVAREPMDRRIVNCIVAMFFGWLVSFHSAYVLSAEEAFTRAHTQKMDKMLWACITTIHPPPATPEEFTPRLLRSPLHLFAFATITYTLQYLYYYLLYGSWPMMTHSLLCGMNFIAPMTFLYVIYPMNPKTSVFYNNPQKKRQLYTAIIATLVLCAIFKLGYIVPQPYHIDAMSMTLYALTAFMVLHYIDKQHS